MLGLGTNVGQLDLGQGREGVRVPVDDLAPPGLELGEPPELHQAQGCGGVRHVVLEPGLHHVVVPGPVGGIPAPRVPAHAVQHPRAGLVHDGRIAGQHAALSGGHVLRRIERETGQATLR